jgi:hypothetical protein
MVVQKLHETQSKRATKFFQARPAETGSLEQKVSYGKAVLGLDPFVTQIFKCDKSGKVASFDNPLYEKEYSEVSAAQAGHELVAQSLARTRLKLKKTK